LKERKKDFEEQKEIQRQLAKEIEQKKKEIQMLNTELKSKQHLVRKL